MENLPETQMPEDKKNPAWVRGGNTEAPPRPDPLPKRQPVPVKRENTLVSIFWAVALALLIRVFLFEPFNIPSTSMVPNLLIGDFLFVSKFSYGYSAKSIGYGLFDFPGRMMEKHGPERGDIVVFKLPTDPSIDYIKRVIGLPGDRIQVIHGILNINGKPIERTSLGTMNYHDEARDVAFQKYDELLPNGVHHLIVEESDDGPLDNTPEYTVPPDHYFMMGDNRDNSQDSRVMSKVGFVPAENLVGKAEIIFFSLNDDTAAWEIWKWPFAIRYGRLLHPIK
jgi:signal peptidase I